MIHELELKNNTEGVHCQTGRDKTTENSVTNIGTQRVQELFFGDRSIRRTVHSNDLVKFFWVAVYSKKETGNL